MAVLLYSDPTGAPARYDLGQRTVVGRHPAQDIQLLDRVVSKEHAIFEDRDGTYFVIDVGSRNGTFLNGHQLTGESQLGNGDEISIGSTTFVFKRGGSDINAVKRVTLTNNGIDSAIRTRVSSQDDLGFLPETKIASHEALRRDYEKLRIANELANALSMELDRDTLLHRILDRAFAIFKCDRGVILLDEETNGNFSPKAARLRQPDASAENIRISETILREVIDNHQAILSSDAMMDSRFSGSHSIIMEGIRSTMTVPLLDDSKLLGIIHLDSQVATGAFSEKDLHLLAGFGRQAAKALEHSNLVEQQKQDALSREKLGRLLPPSVVEQILEGKVDIRKGGDIKETTVMFCDIRGFTAMSELIPPVEIVQMLNEYFEIMVEVIFRRNGTLDKFVGDEIMAIWGAPFSRPDDIQQAVWTAIEMQKALLEFNETRRNEGMQPIYAGIGLNTGEVVAGYMGSTRSMSYTVVGDVVNTASRICSLAGPNEIVISKPVMDRVADHLGFDALPPTMVKGKREPIEVFRIKI